MASQTQRKYQRRSAAEWRALLDAQATSGLSVGTFCRKVSVCTASFYRWQGVLEGHGDAGPGTSETVADRVPARATPHRTPDFVDLGALKDLAAPVPRDDIASPRVEQDIFDAVAHGALHTAVDILFEIFRITPLVAVKTVVTHRPRTDPYVRN